MQHTNVGRCDEEKYQRRYNEDLKLGHFAMTVFNLPVQPGRRVEAPSDPTGCVIARGAGMQL